MDFFSLSFLSFFAIIAVLYYSIRHQYRWILLLIVSYYFYMSFEPTFAIWIACSTLVTYISALFLDTTKRKSRRKLILSCAVSLNLATLIVLKYTGFIFETTRTFFAPSMVLYGNPIAAWVLPLGISYYTFQTISYVIDVYRKQIKPERHLGIFALYVSFFPKLLAGPIERGKDLIPQLYRKHGFDYAGIQDGLKLVVWGIFKKLVIADRLAIFVNSVFNTVNSQSFVIGKVIFPTPYYVIATIFFAIQIYCDFSAYTDIAIGTAQVFGIRLSDNFRRPYFSRSIQEFWRRWHITLSSWARDYVYIPLGGNRVRVPRMYFNIMIVFLVIGIWHGPSWTFIAWGHCTVSI